MNVVSQNRQARTHLQLKTLPRSIPVSLSFSSWEKLTVENLKAVWAEFSTLS